MAIPRALEVALDMLPHLVRCAHMRRTITYQELGQLVGKPAFFLGTFLDALRDQLLEPHNLPRLDALVVNKERGEAGSSFYSGGRDQMSDDDYHTQLEYERDKVFNYANWEAIVLKLQAHYGGEEYIKSRGLARRS